eukprot:TRINITY_DN66302_c12_g4_i1.p1 TRINITY_DN66302_c12_g4~~TRINITY_DN66302_c12_g4_i1.p1  ORF type:complete len:313 (+),score=26.26 TRINITY_DN66302_c12_g4_i1:39-977(+)
MNFATGKKAGKKKKAIDDNVPSTDDNAWGHGELVVPIDPLTHLPIVGVPREHKGSYLDLERVPVMFFEILHRYNYMSWRAVRILVVTRDTILLAEEDGTLERCVAIRNLSNAKVESNIVALIFTSEYDLLMTCKSSARANILLHVLGCLRYLYTGELLPIQKVEGGSSVEAGLNLKPSPHHRFRVPAITTIADFEEQLGNAIDTLPQLPLGSVPEPPILHYGDSQLPLAIWNERKQKEEQIQPRDEPIMSAAELFAQATSGHASSSASGATALTSAALRKLAEPTIPDEPVDELQAFGTSGRTADQYIEDTL